MLATLRIQNVVLIEQLTIDFYDGLCALTGETGAGKSILLDSLGLARGARADSGLVRKGADQANVTAVFEVDEKHPAKTILQEQGLEFEPTLMLRRTLNSDGRSRAFINDQPVSAGLLRIIGESVLEVHGQFDTQGLLAPQNHRSMLDEYAGIGDDIEELWSKWQGEKEKLETLKNMAASSQAEEEYLRTSLEDLDALEPTPGEEETLATLRESLMHREQILEALGNAYQILDSEHDPVRSAWSTLDRMADKLGEQGDAILGALDRAASEVQEAISEIQSLSADLEESEHDFQSIDDRLHALRAQARKHSCNVDDLSAKREELAEKLNQIEHADDAISAQAKAVETAKAEFAKEAERISALRQKTAQDLDALVQKELPPLKLERAVFVTRVDTLEEPMWNAHGMDKVQFLVATNPGAEPGQLSKVASGGELSRFMLALKVVMAKTGSAGALIFDEVDAGIGGGTADAVGERLSRLAQQDKQVLVVTHSPQVAARAAHHYIVQKGGDDTVTTSVLRLENNQKRREEIARMLAGATISEEARAAADKLLETGKAA